MMSKKQLACMLALHIVYLLVGASIFYHIESPLELAQRAEEKLERLEIQSKSITNIIDTYHIGNMTLKLLKKLYHILLYSLHSSTF